MKRLFIEAKYEGKIKLSDTDKLPNTIGLCSSVQFIDSILEIKKQLEESGKSVILVKGKHSIHKGQILGCDVIEGLDSYDVDAFLYIGDGLFHPKALMLTQDKDVFSYNPFSKKMKQMSTDDINRMRIRQKAVLTKFHSKDNIGIIISNKPGQNNYVKADLLIKKYPNKSFYKFVSDTINFNDLENFNFIDVWVSTACPRIGYDDMLSLEISIIDVNSLLD